MTLCDASAHFDLGDRRIQTKLTIVYAVEELKLAGRSALNAMSVEVKWPSP